MDWTQRPLRASALTAWTIAALFVMLSFCETSVAQEGQSTTPAVSRRFSDQPIVVAYSRGLSPKDVLSYVARVAKNLDKASDFLREIEDERQQEQMAASEPNVEDPLYGFALYMVAGLIPSFDTVTFQQVVDEDDARRLINGRKSQMGDQATLVDRGNGCFRLESRISWESELPASADPAAYENNNGPYPSGYQLTQNVIERDGKRFLKSTQVMTTLFRYHEGLLYEAGFDELLEMQLPSADSIRSGMDGSRDLGFNAWLDRIPTGIRQLGWSMLNGAVGSQLQQRDGEADVLYNMRRTSGDMVMALIQAILFDVNSADGWADFAGENEGSLRAQLRIRSRGNSALSGRLAASSGTSRLAPILADSAVATLHLCFRLSDEAPQALQAAADWLLVAAKNDDGGVEAAAAAETAAGLLRQVAEHRNLELLLKIGHTQESDGIIYGAIQLGENESFLHQLYELLRKNAPAGAAEQLTYAEDDGIPMIRLQLPESSTVELRQQLGTNLTDVYLAHQNACLWFALGTENAGAIIRTSVARCFENSRGAKTPLMSGRVDMQKWLALPQDDPAGIAQMPHWLDENKYWFPPSPFSIDMLDMPDGDPVPVMMRVFDAGGDQQAGFSLESDDGGLLLDISLGEALANHMVARMISRQQQFMTQPNEVERTQTLEFSQPEAPGDGME